ncbi:uncharacterized protein SRS1_10032 [Sporisorium reilianum f. sp. reilianum]|uniref:Uncharacterized protein n=1 Tax=Sporisorium reilianum f. sp. reilianum TaxID=72559 RepID=A0A2N8ULC0_9BASI|nr:uncharacterized protein SRS1_10032 [Sporisorium reilianum f. sp. reilianum]
MARLSSSQPLTSRTSAAANRAGSSRNPPSPSSSSSNARASNSAQQAEDDEAAARRERRRRRREQEAYHVKGWENLFRGDGSKPVFAHDPKPSRRNRADPSSSQPASTSRERTHASSSQPLARARRDSSSSTRQTQSPIKASSSVTTSSQQLPPSTAPARSSSTASHATTSRLSKRKATSPSSQSSPSKKARAPTSSRRQPTPEASAQDSSDDGFEITGVSGPAANRASTNEAPAPTVKASPSPTRALKASQPTRSTALRRSASRSPSAGHPSPAPPRWSADNERPSPTSGPASRASSHPRASRAPSSTSSTGPAKLTPEDIEALREVAYDAFIQGVSLPDHICQVVRDYLDMLSANHADRPKVEQFQKRLAHLGPQLTIQYLRQVMPTLPPRLAKRFGPALKAYIRYLRSEGNDDQDSADQSVDSILALDPTTAASIEALASTAAVDSEGAPGHVEVGQSPAEASAATSPSPPAVQETEQQGPARAAVTDPISAASDQAQEQEAGQCSSTSADVEAEPMDVDSTNDPDTAPAPARTAEPDAAGASHDSAADSAGSPQAFGTPPEQTPEGEEEDEVNGSSQPEPQEPRMLDESRHSEAPEDQSQQSELHEQPDREASAQSEDEEAHESEHEPPQLDQQSQDVDEHEEEEDELVDELDDDQHNESIAGHQAQDVAAPAATHGVAASTPPAETLEQDARPKEGENEAQAVSDNELSHSGHTNSDAPLDRSVDASDQPTGTADANVETSEVQHADSPIASSPAAPQSTEANDAQVEGAEQAGPGEQAGEQQASPQHSDGDQDTAVAANAATDDEEAEETLPNAPDSSEAPAPTEGLLNEDTVDDLEPPADPDADRVATAVEAVEQALAAESDVHPVEGIDESILASGAATAAEPPMQEDDQTAASDASFPQAAASEARTVATPSPPSRSNSVEADSEAQEATRETGGDTVLGTSHGQTEAQPAVETEAPQQVASAPAAAPAAATRASTVPADIVAVSDLTASAAAEEAPAQAEHASEPPVETDTALQDDPAGVASRNLERASSQATSDCTTVARPKRSIDDRMKSMLKDLSHVTGRRSSYRTIQKWKLLRAGFGTRQTIQDLVEHWQDPKKMIPWTCLQELGPAIFHKNAHKHMHVSMHELTDRISSTRSVQHLSGKLPERVMTRALMEFPRIPHMLHCWNEEKNKYFATRGLPQPTDTKPEFRFADEQRTGDNGPRLLGVPDASSRAAQSRGSPLAVPAMTQSAGPSNTVQSSNTNALAPLASYISGPTQQVAAAAAAPPLSAAAVPPRMPTQLNPQQLIAANMAQIATTMAPAYNAQQVAVMPSGAVRPVPLQQHVFRQAAPQHVQSQAAPPRAQQQQQQQQQQQPMSDNARRAAMIKEATERVFSGLVADCLSFAEHVTGSAASATFADKHFSEADVLSVLTFVADTYKNEAEEARKAGVRVLKALERLSKVMRVHEVGMEMLKMTQMLFRVKMCLNDAAIEALRRTGVASTEHWCEHLNAAPKWSGLKQYLLQDEQGLGMLSRAESHMLLRKQVDRLNKRLEATLEKMISMDEVVGPRLGDGADAQDVAEQDQIRSECDQIGRICCKHVVGILVGDSEGQ